MQKKSINIVFTGHVDHGKSTLIGRLLLSTSSLAEGKLSEIKVISRNLGKATELAFIVDQLKEERKQNKTIDTTQIPLKIKNRRFTIIDTPGHVKLLKNMITGATEGDSGLVIIDALEGIMEQTKRHIYILQLIGIDKIIFAINKMDLADYQEALFNKVKGDLLEFIKNTTMQPLAIVPISAKEDSNISHRSKRMSWYKGPFLLEALSLLSKKIFSDKKPMRFSVQDIYTLDEEKIIAGRVESGTIKESQEAYIFPSGQSVHIKTIKIFGRRKVSYASSGQCIGIMIDKNLDIKRGYVFTDPNNPPELTNTLEGHILWLLKEPLKINSHLKLRCLTQETECVISRIKNRIDSSNLNIIEENALELRINEGGIVTISTKTPIVIEKFSYIPGLGRFTMEKNCEPVGIGIVI